MKIAASANGGKHARLRSTALIQRAISSIDFRNWRNPHNKEQPCLLMGRDLLAKTALNPC
jgi:hypothetical protein